MQQHILEGFVRAKAQLAELERASEQTASKTRTRKRHASLAKVRSWFVDRNLEPSLRSNTARTA